MDLVGTQRGGMRLGILVLPVVALLLLLAQALPISRTAARPAPTPAVKKIAVVNDDQDRLDTIAEYVSIFMTGSLPVPFLNCESLLATMQAGERFQAYIMDYDMPGGMNGLACTRAVLVLDPTAVVIGNTMKGELGIENQFLEIGAKAFNKGASEGLINILKGLGF